MGKHTALGRTKIFAGGGCPRTSTTGLLDAQSTTFKLLALEALLGSIGLVRGHHLHKAEATRLPRVRVAHDLALLNLSIFLKHAGHFSLSKTWVNAGDEEIGAWVNGISVAIPTAAVVTRRSTVIN